LKITYERVLMQKIKKFLLFVVIIATLYLLYAVLIIEKFTDLLALARLDIDSEGYLDNFTMLIPIYTYQNKSFKVKHFDLRPGSIKNYSISIVEAKYGEMWEIKV